jgi:hypothetical protein
MGKAGAEAESREAHNKRAQLGGSGHVISSELFIARLPERFQPSYDFPDS